MCPAPQEDPTCLTKYAQTSVTRTCVDDGVPTITIRKYHKQKPWMNGDIHTMLRAHTAAFNVSRMTHDDSVVRTGQAGMSSPNQLGMQKDNTDSN